MKPAIPENGTPLTKPAGDGASERVEISLHGEILSRLRDYVVEGNLPEGARVPERQLCEMFGSRLNALVADRNTRTGYDVFDLTPGLPQNEHAGDGCS